MANGRVSNQGVTFVIGDASITSSGSVGLIDETLEIMLQIPHSRRMDLRISDCCRVFEGTDRPDPCAWNVVTTANRWTGHRRSGRKDRRRSAGRRTRQQN